MSSLVIDNVEAAAAGAYLHEHAKDVKADGSKIAPVDHTLGFHSAHLDEKEMEVEDLDYVRPTEEERISLRRVPAAIPLASFLIAFCELSERFSYYGSQLVFQNFVQYPLGSRTGAGFADGQSGALNKGQQIATGMNTLNTFWVYTMPLLGAYVADTYLGRYKTICLAVFIALIGHIILIICSLPSVMTDSNGAFAAFVIAILVMGVGTGAFKSNISPMLAEQQKATKQSVAILKTGEKVIIDPALTTARIFMYFYLFINIGALIGQIGMSFAEKYVGYWLAYSLPTIVFLFNPIVLYLGYNMYVKSPPSGSVLGQSLRIVRHSSKNKWSWNPIKTIKQMKAPGFWEASKPSQQVDENKAKWMTFDDRWVDEVRRGFKACQVFAFFPLYWLSYNQINNNLTSQAATLDVGGLPNEIVSNLDPFALIIFIPLLDLFGYPLLRKWGFKFTPLKKITAGFLFGSAAMICAAVQQHYIYARSPCGAHAGGSMLDATGNEVACGPAPMTVWIQVPTYVLIALSEIFASITGLEYAFTKAPKSMRSLVMSAFLFTSAISAALGEAFISLSTDPLLVWNYAVFAVLAFVGGVAFWICFRDLDAEEDSLNQLDEGKVAA